MPINLTGTKSKLTTWRRKKDSKKKIKAYTAPSIIINYLDNDTTKHKDYVYLDRSFVKSEFLKGTRQGFCSTIIWGYPKNFRNRNHLVDICNNFSEIERIFSSTNDFSDSQIDHMLSIDGLGISTLSKLLYFSNKTYKGRPTLICDQFIAEVSKRQFKNDFTSVSKIGFHSYCYREFYDNILNDFVNIKDTINQSFLNSSEINRVSEEKIEAFMFLIGRTFRPH